jgi:membrane associated rhomboid family serine protease
MMQWFIRRRLTTPLSLQLSGYLCFVYVLTLVIPQIGEIFLLFPERVVRDGEVWRVFTYGMLSANLLSLILLVISTLWFGVYLEPALGQWRYLAIYLVPQMASAVLIVLMRSGSLEGLPYSGSFIVTSGVFGAFVAWAIAHFRTTNWRVRLLALPAVLFWVALLISPVETIGIHAAAWAAAIAIVYPALRRSLPS